MQPSTHAVRWAAMLGGALTPPLCQRRVQLIHCQCKSRLQMANLGIHKTLLIKSSLLDHTVYICHHVQTLRQFCSNSRVRAVFYLKNFEHPSFGQVAHEIYPSEWKVHSSEISITLINVLLIHVFDGCSNRFDPCDHFNLVCCCRSPVSISDKLKRSCWKISQSLKPIWLDVEMLVPL